MHLPEVLFLCLSFKVRCRFGLSRSFDPALALAFLLLHLVFRLFHLFFLECILTTSFLSLRFDLLFLLIDLFILSFRLLSSFFDYFFRLMFRVFLLHHSILSSHLKPMSIYFLNIEFDYLTIH